MNLIREGIYNKCREESKGIFWYLTKDNFANAKAFWGDDFACPYCGGKGYVYGDDRVGYWTCGDFDCDYSESFCTEDWEEIPTLWQYHLTRMVLKKTPLQYLLKFLERKEKGK